MTITTMLATMRGAGEGAILLGNDLSMSAEAPIPHLNKTNKFVTLPVRTSFSDRLSDTLALLTSCVVLYNVHMFYIMFICIV